MKKYNGNDFYVVTKNTRIGEQNLKAGTVIYATGGGYYKNFKKGINAIGELQSSADIKRINNPIMSHAVDLSIKIMNFGESIFNEIESNPENAEKIVSEKQKLLNQIERML